MLSILMANDGRPAFGPSAGRPVSGKIDGGAVVVRLVPIVLDAGELFAFDFEPQPASVAMRANASADAHARRAPRR